MTSIKLCSLLAYIPGRIYVSDGVSISKAAGSKLTTSVDEGARKPVYAITQKAR